MLHAGNWNQLEDKLTIHSLCLEGLNVGEHFQQKALLRFTSSTHLIEPELADSEDMLQIHIVSQAFAHMG